MRIPTAPRFLVIMTMSSLLLAGSLAACGSPASSGSAPSPIASGPASPDAASPDPAIAAVGRAYVEALAGGDMAAAEAMEDKTMRGAAPAAALAQLWTQLVDQFGAFGGVGAVATVPSGAFVNATVEGRFARNTVPLIVTVDKEGKVAGLHLGEPGPPASGEPSASGSAPSMPAASASAEAEPSPAAYVDPDAFTETEVTIGSGQWALPGTLSMPVGDGPFPAVVLVAGSGPNDRDETIGPNKPLRDIAWGLASNGIAVLRYDKRTKAHQAEMGGLADTLTVQEEVVDDAVLAVDLLRATDGIDPDRVAVAGHSLGGYLAPRIAAQANAAGGRVAGIALLEGSISPLEDLVVAQLTYLASDEGGADPQAKQLLDGLAAQVAKVKSADLTAGTPAAELPLGIPAAYWLDLRTYDPGATAAALGIPILVVQGGRDYQVPPTEGAGWRAALSDAGSATFKDYPALNHLMHAGSGPSHPSEYAIAGHVDGAVIGDFAAWVHALP